MSLRSTPSAEAISAAAVAVLGYSTASLAVPWDSITFVIASDLGHVGSLEWRVNSTAGATASARLIP